MEEYKEIKGALGCALVCVVIGAALMYIVYVITCKLIVLSNYFLS